MKNKLIGWRQKKNHKVFYFLWIPIFKKSSIQKVMNQKIESLENQIHELQEAVISLMDVGHMPKATGFSRTLQLLTVEIMQEIDRVCKLHGLQYWLGYGSAIGALRHDGIIPWDDDLDLCMLHDDWVKFNEVAKTDMKPEYKNFVLPGDIGRVCLSEFAPSNDDELIGWRHWDKQSKLLFGVDIFPVHWLRDDISRDDAIAKMQQIRDEKAAKVFSAPRDIALQERFQRETDEAQQALIGKPQSRRLFASMHCLYDIMLIWHSEDIFPLRPVSFEHVTSYVANHAEVICWQQYGDFYKPKITHMHLSLKQLDRQEMLKLIQHGKRLGVMK